MIPIFIVLGFASLNANLPDKPGNDGGCGRFGAGGDQGIFFFLTALVLWG